MRSLSARSSFKQSAGRARAGFFVLPDGPGATKAGHRDTGAGVACNKAAITHSADSLACGLAGCDKAPPRYWKQFARHGQAFYRPSGTLHSKLLKVIEPTQRRKGAETQGFGFLSSFIRWVSDSSPSFPSHLPALCVFASWRRCVN
jgi:hypothetical protein